jgi:hypothetical protein
MDRQVAEHQVQGKEDASMSLVMYCNVCSWCWLHTGLSIVMLRQWRVKSLQNPFIILGFSLAILNLQCFNELLLDRRTHEVHLNTRLAGQLLELLNSMADTGFLHILYTILV